jgi:hypothetical protein
MPDNSLPPGARGNAQVVEHSQTFHQGPLPSPEAFEKYNRVLPGAAARILRMAEKQASHRQDLESRALRGDLAKSMMGTILAYIAFGGAMHGAVYLLLHDKPIQSLAALITVLGAPKSMPTSSNPSPSIQASNLLRRGPRELPALRRSTARSARRPTPKIRDASASNFRALPLQNPSPHCCIPALR